MVRTVLVCLGLAWGSYGAAHWLTHDFSVWTAEGARRLEVELHPVPAPPVPIDGPHIAGGNLARWLGDGQSVTVLDFVYTRCPSVCLSLGTAFQRMQASLELAQATDPRSQRVRLMSISFDGQHDTPPVLADYAARLGARAPQWQFLRVPHPQELAQLLARFQVVVVPDAWGGLEHNAAILVVDPHGRLVRIFDYGQQQLALDFALHLADGMAL